MGECTFLLPPSWCNFQPPYSHNKDMYADSSPGFGEDFIRGHHCCERRSLRAVPGPPSSGEGPAERAILLCLENPGNGTKIDWNALVKGESLGEFLKRISEAKKLVNVTIPRCTKRHSLEPEDIQERDLYYQHSCENQRECFGGWERFTELESIQWLADGEPANDREGASGVLQLKRNDPMEGATENSLQIL